MATDGFRLAEGGFDGSDPMAGTGVVVLDEGESLSVTYRYQLVSLAPISPTGRVRPRIPGLYAAQRACLGASAPRSTGRSHEPVATVQPASLPEQQPHRGTGFRRSTCR